ncbi:MAG: ROK family protein [Nitrospirae bacterium]|nr:ROK family protein [Nitrospirota bacterium]
MSMDGIAIGLDIGGTNLRVAQVTYRGEVLKRTRRETSQDIVKDIIESIDELITEDTVGIGIGIAGVVDSTSGVVKRSPNLSQAEGIDLKSILSDKYNLPIRIDNDANAATLGERFVGAGRRFEDFVMLTLGTGIGGGVVINGALLKTASELGHITVEANGKKCLCPNSGCLEAYASGRAIVSDVIDQLEKGADSLLKDCCEGNIYKITPEDVYNYALEGDTLARETLKNAGKYLGIGIASLVNIFSPQAVIIGGGLTGAWDILVREAIREANKRAFPELIENVEILPAQLADNAGVVGAASLVLYSSEAK